MRIRQLCSDVDMGEEAEIRRLESGTPVLPLLPIGTPDLRRVRLRLRSPPTRPLRQRVSPPPNVLRSPTHTQDDCAASVTSSPDAENVLQSDRSGLTVCPTHNNQAVVGGDTRINLERMTPDFPLTSEPSRELVQVLSEIAW